MYNKIYLLLVYVGVIDRRRLRGGPRMKRIDHFEWIYAPIFYGAAVSIFIAFQRLRYRLRDDLQYNGICILD